MTTARRLRTAWRGCCLAAASAQAQSYPTRTVTIVVTSAAGGSTDVLTRAVAQRLSQKWGQQVVVENRGGAGHTFAAPRGRSRPSPTATRCCLRRPAFSTSQPHLYAKGKLPLRTRNDFVPIAGYAGIPMALLVHPSVPAKSVPELIALAKQKPSALTYGTAGLGTGARTPAHCCWRASPGSS